jgi:DNA repair exonuclease SbcCD nuclease subunit
MKTVILGDIHGRSFWKDIVNHENPDKVIFVGDYFDSFKIKTDEQLNNFLDIVEYKKTSGKEVILLIGNHDIHYYPEISDTGTSGYQTIGRLQIEPTIDSNREHLQMAYKMDEFLFTHAGVSSEWLDDNVVGWDVDNIADKINELFHYQPNRFNFRSFKQYSKDRTVLSDGHGSNTYQTPIWIRPKALMAANKDTLRKKIIQVVGHTWVDEIDKEGKATGGRYYFIDTMDTSQEYMIVTDGDISFNSLKEGYGKKKETE